MAESPAVMQASVYTYDKDNNIVYAPSEGSERLAKNLAVIGATSALAPLISTAAPYVGHVGEVLLNPAAAKTALGASMATTADIVGTGYGVKRNSELLDK